MIKIAVCEDAEKDLKILKKLLTTYKNQRSEYNLYIDYFNNPIDLLHHVENNVFYDLYILDVNMRIIKGSQVAIEVKRLNKNCEIIFITASKNHAIFAYQIEALQYLLKPVNKNILYNTLDRFLKSQRNLEEYKVVLKTTQGYYNLNTNKVVYSEPERNNYQAIILEDKSKLIVRMTVRDLYKVLSKNPTIVRCGASLNINLKFISSINNQAIIFDNKKSLIYPIKAYSKLKHDFLTYKYKSQD